MGVEYQIIKYLKEHIEASPNEIFENIGVSRQMLHRILKKLLEDEILEKIGRPPKVFYKLKQEPVQKTGREESVTKEQIEFLEEHFNLFTETGNELNGLEAFQRWCAKKQLPLQKTVDEFIKTRKKYLAYFGRNGLIKGTDKLKNTKGFASVCVDDVFYGDYYAIERFGKTKLGNLLHFAKQGQSKPLMEKICMLIKPKLENLIMQLNIDAVGYIPPTLKREVQIMNYMKRSFNLSLPHINLKKVSGPVPVPQKSLAKLEDRISNAIASIVVDDKRYFSKILLVDDALGSGATINETACKLKLKKMTTSVIGFAVVGSFKGFDVIQEV